MQAPHIIVLIFMRGLMRHLVTRIYLPQHPMNAGDPVLQLVPKSRRDSLIALSTNAGGDALRWDVHIASI